MRVSSMITNSTANANVFSNIYHKFVLLYARRYFNILFIGAGFEDGKFFETNENVAIIEKDYGEVGAQTTK
jgi:hypothetical protein